MPPPKKDARAKKARKVRKTATGNASPEAPAKKRRGASTKTRTHVTDIPHGYRGKENLCLGEVAPMGEPYIMTAGAEIHLMIAFYLDITDIKALRRVNRHFRQIGTRELAKGKIVVLPAWHLIRGLEKCSSEFKNQVRHVSLPAGKWVRFETKDEWYEAGASKLLKRYSRDNIDSFGLYEEALKLRQELEDDHEKVFKKLLKLFPSLSTVELGQKVSGGTHYSQICNTFRCKPLCWNDDLGNESSLQSLLNVLRECGSIRHIIFQQETPFCSWKCDAKYLCPTVETLDVTLCQQLLLGTRNRDGYEILAAFPALKELRIQCNKSPGGAEYPMKIDRNMGNPSLSDILAGLTFDHLSLVSLSGITCSELDLQELFSRHAKTLQHLCLGDVLLDGTWASVLNNLRCQKLSLKSITIDRLEEESPKRRIQFRGSKKGMETLALFLSSNNAWELQLSEDDWEVEWWKWGRWRIVLGSKAMWEAESLTEADADVEFICMRSQSRETPPGIRLQRRGY